MQIQNLKNFTISCAKVIVFLFVLTLMISMGGLVGTVQAETKRVVVDCDVGETIGNALQLGADWKGIEVIVKGTCNENVTIERDDVTLRGFGELGGTVSGGQPGQSTIRIDGAKRITIDNLNVTGGLLNGVVGFNGASFVVQNSVIESNTWGGVAAILNSSAIIENVTIRGNGSDGVYLEGSTATITECTINRNRSSGIRVSGVTNARIGLTIANIPAGNTISGNGEDGISVYNCSNAFIYGNEITSNGRNGVDIGNASARLVGENTISENENYGVIVYRGGMLLQGQGDFGITPNHDLIERNGSSGIVAFNNATLDIQDATIRGNSEHGIVLSLHSTLRIFNSKVRRNTMNGILLFGDSGLLLQTPDEFRPVNVSSNGYYDIKCMDQESSIDGDQSGVGTIDGCSGF